MKRLDHTVKDIIQCPCPRKHVGVARRVASVPVETHAAIASAGHQGAVRVPECGVIVIGGSASERVRCRASYVNFALYSEPMRSESTCPRSPRNIRSATIPLPVPPQLLSTWPKLPISR